MASDRQVVIDAGAVIRLQRLERFGKDLYTTRGVLAEVRDERARALLGTLPCEIHLREPSAEDVRYVKGFAKATGDFGFLSANDLELIALTVALHKEAGGRLREGPKDLVSCEGSLGFDWAPLKASEEAVRPSGQPLVRIIEAPSPPRSRASSEGAGEATAEGDGEWQVASKRKGRRWCGGGRRGVPEPPPRSAEMHLARSQKTQVSISESEDESSGGDWVTPENFHHFGRCVEGGAELLKVTCATADYSMQNVLLQLGIPPLTFDGYAVRCVKLWGLICRACFFYHRQTHKAFCPKCGNDTVVRVPIVIGQDGQPTVINSGRPLRTKGVRCSLPKPTGGRGFKPIFAEDELLIGGRDRQLRHQEKLREKERKAHDPFHEASCGKPWWQRGSKWTRH